MIVSVHLPLNLRLRKPNLIKDTVVSDLDRAGFMLNIMKSQLSPVQVIDWLGFTLDLREGCFSVLNSNLIICCMQLLPVS